MKTSTILLLLGACLASQCQAQSFGDIFRSAANSAATSAATSAADEAARGLVSSLVDKVKGGGNANKPAQPPGASGCKPERGADLLIGPRPDDFVPAGLWPENAECPVGGFTGLSFEKAKAAKTAFADASKVPCKDCEGGYEVEGWGAVRLVRSGDYHAQYLKMLLALDQGKSLGWSGKKRKFTVTATGEHPVGDTPCKQFHYQMKEGAATIAEYDSMLCQYKMPYAGQASWNEVI